MELHHSSTKKTINNCQREAINSDEFEDDVKWYTAATPMPPKVL